MKNKNEDTRELLCAALKKCMAGKPLSKITIKELTDLTHIRRQSFYYYFEDIYDLLKWEIRRETEECVRRHGNMVTWQEALMDIFHYIQINKAQCLCILKSENREYMDQLFYEDLCSIFQKNAFPYNFLPHYGKEEEKLIEFSMHFLVISLTALYENWLCGNVKESPEYILMALETIFTDRVKGSAQRNRSVEEALKQLREQGIQIKLP